MYFSSCSYNSVIALLVDRLYSMYQMQHCCIILRPIYKVMPLDSEEIVCCEKDLKTKETKTNQQNHS